MKKYISLLILGLIFSSGIYSQKILLHETPPEDTIIEDFGPNRKHYFHLFLSAGSILPEPSENGGEIESTSFYVDFGYRYKYKLCKRLAVGGNFSYNIQSYALEQKKRKIVPDTLLHDKEKLVTQNLGLSIFERINFGRRGNTIGKYFDIGAYADWVFMMQHTTKDEIEDKKYKTRVTGMGYYNPFVYGFYSQIGFGRLAVFGKYRYSDMFRDNNLKELPRIIVGLQLGFSQ